MGQALYRKYRSKSLSEIVGQEHITDTLSTALKSGRISHAYLFTGPRGVGKTSIARILAHEVNDLKYDESQTHIDIIEIDAASNRRIDEIRDLRDKVHIAPASAKYKVYIIDEVHMLTKEAFNALLKTLEEPPAHVIFILATTEAHKLPETIVSRTQRYVFRPIEPAKAVAHLKVIAKQEGITISDEALELVAQHGEGSFRDSISLLDQSGNHGGPVEAADIRSMLGIPQTEALTAVLDDIEQQASVKQLLTQLTQLYEQGFQASAIASQLSTLIRERTIAGNIDTSLATSLLTDLLEVPAAHDPDRYLEIVLLKKAANTTHQASAKANVIPTEVEGSRANQQQPEESKRDLSTEPVQDSDPVLVMTKKNKPLTESKAADKPVSKTKAMTKTQPALKGNDEEVWKAVLNSLKQHYNTLYGVVRMAQPTFGADSVELTFAFAFHQKRAHEAKNLQIIRAAFAAAMGDEAVTVSCSFDPDLKLTQTKSTTTAPLARTPAPSLATISNIFGATEVLE